MADDPLAPSLASDSLLRLPVGQLGLNPYSALFAGHPEQLQAYNLLTEPIFQYTFGPAGPLIVGIQAMLALEGEYGFCIAVNCSGAAITWSRSPDLRERLTTAQARQKFRFSFSG
jgi:hypothetical protein